MKDFIVQNGWALAIGLASLVVSYALYGYRIQALENNAAVLGESIDSLNTQQSQIQVELASINTNIEYIKEALSLNTSAYAR